MASLDPFLHDWDERFHALVAKNMVNYPFKPMLRLDPVLAYDYKAWCCNHIWLHKQPVFLWQMALSIQLLGNNELAVRLPSVIMGTIMVLLVYRIATLALNNRVGYCAALLFATAYYQLEQTSGLIGMDHNDVSFMFYNTAAVWSLCEYFNSKNNKYVLLIGLFSGLAILNKWLVGLLVYALWFLAVLGNRATISFHFKRFGIALLLTVVVVLPWQWHIYTHFPAESLFEWQYNSQHLWEVIENHSAPWYYYLQMLPIYYNYGVVPLLFTGIVMFYQKATTPFRTVILSAIALIYAFFSIAQTKLPGYAYVVAPLLYVVLGIGIANIVQYLRTNFSHRLVPLAFLMLVALWCLRFDAIKGSRGGGAETPNRAAEINNTKIYKKLNDLVPKDYVLLNCKSFDDTKAMFYADRNAYSWYPSEQEYQTLKLNSVKFAAFKDHTNQALPDYIKQDPDLLLINEELK